MTDLVVEAQASAADRSEPVPASATVDETRPSLARRALMEGIGVYALVVAGCGAIITNTVTGILGPYDTLRFKFRVSVPSDYATLGKISYRIGIDFDVL